MEVGWTKDRVAACILLQQNQINDCCDSTSEYLLESHTHLSSSR